nr:sulfite exporter TauE/SafE family protein [Alkalinema sp. FACHB-956]
MLGLLDTATIATPESLLGLFGLGIFTGAVAGVLGIGGGLLIVPVLSLWSIPLVQATATSLVGVWMSAVSGTVQNWRKGQLDGRSSIVLAVFGMVTASLGAWVGKVLPNAAIAFSFAGLMWVIIYLMDLKQKLKVREKTITDATESLSDRRPPEPLRLPQVAGIGLGAGFLSGLFGVGGGAIMVPLQMLFLGEPIKSAVRTSLGAIVLIAMSGLVSHTLNGNVLWPPGIAIALGGMLGAQLGTRLLNRLSSKAVDRTFRGLLILLSVYMVWKGFSS